MGRLRRSFPVPRQSGKFTGRTHISKRGNARPRRAFPSVP
ncbi:transposase [Deinococcus oregonensis]|uniref:Transposase n=1 Tax=Deinococcus oregonensis TaxID=1805970 RepID=A0ABV6B276_9DEIO